MNIIQIPKYNNSVKGKVCVVCGEPAFAHLDGKPYCRKHYMQMKRGGIKERTTRDPNELIDMGACIKIVLYNRLGLKIDDFGIIDDDSLNLIQGKKIGYGKFGDKKYCYININGKPTLLHRYIWESLKGKIPNGKVIDHINGNGLDCRLSNLRLASSLQNSYNLGKGDKYTGVNPYGDRYSARIMHDRKDYNLGIYPTEKEALKARIDAERKYFGDFGPNVSRFDRGLINYSTNNLYYNGQKLSSNAELSAREDARRKVLYSGNILNFPKRNDAMALLYPTYWSNVMVRANMDAVNPPSPDAGFWERLGKGVGNEMAKLALAPRELLKKDDWIKKDQDKFLLGLEGEIGRKLSAEEREHLIKNVLDPEKVDKRFTEHANSKMAWDNTRGAFTVATSAASLPIGLLPGIAAEFTIDTALSVPSDKHGAELNNLGSYLTKEQLAMLTERAKTMSPRLWKKVDLLEIMTPDSEKEKVRKIISDYRENEIKRLRDLEKLDIDNGNYHKKENKDEATGNKPQLTENNKTTNPNTSNSSTNPVPPTSPVPSANPVDTNNDNNYKNVVLPVSLGALALGGYMLYKKNKNKKKKKNPLDEE